MSAPKVFLGHPSEDKDCFVVEFARRVLDNGVDARAVIVVPSNVSVQKPRVRIRFRVSCSVAILSAW